MRCPACIAAPSRQPGFTLLEMLVVLILIGVTVSVVVLSSGHDRSRQLEQEARRLVELMRLAQEEAVLNGQELAIRFHPHGYEFQQPAEDAWQTLQQPRLLRPRRLDADLRLRLYQDGLPVSLREAGAGRILILSSGELTPFELRLDLQHAASGYRILGTALGQLLLEAGDA